MCHRLKRLSSMTYKDWNPTFLSIRTRPVKFLASTTITKYQRGSKPLFLSVETNMLPVIWSANVCTWTLSNIPPPAPPTHLLRPVLLENQLQPTHTHTHTHNMNCFNGIMAKATYNTIASLCVGKCNNQLSRESGKHKLLQLVLRSNTCWPLTRLDWALVHVWLPRFKTA